MEEYGTYTTSYDRAGDLTKGVPAMTFSQWDLPQSTKDTVSGEAEWGGEIKLCYHDHIWRHLSNRTVPIEHWKVLKKRASTERRSMGELEGRTQSCV